MSVIAERAEGIADMIRRQIGTDVWLAVSARDPRYWTTDAGNTVLAFRFGSRYGLPKWCEITYRPGPDDYAMTAYRIRRNGVKSVLSIPDEYGGRDVADYRSVYADMVGAWVRHFNLMGELA